MDDFLSKATADIRNQLYASVESWLDLDGTETTEGRAARLRACGLFNSAQQCTLVVLAKLPNDPVFAALVGRFAYRVLKERWARLTLMKHSEMTTEEIRKFAREWFSALPEDTQRTINTHYVGELPQILIDPRIEKEFWVIIHICREEARLHWLNALLTDDIDYKESFKQDILDTFGWHEEKDIKKHIDFYKPGGGYEDR